jgi:CRP/FNR family cyclic AMP-dependent transcriptional regulator
MARVKMKPVEGEWFHFHEHRECRVLTETVLQHLPGAPERGTVRRVTRGDLVYAMGDPTGDVFFLRRGRVAISMISPDGRERRLMTVEPGEMFGELCFCNVRARPEQAAALAASEIVPMRMDDLLDAILASRDGTTAMLGTLCARVSEAQEQILRLAFHTVPQRIGLLLLSLSRSTEALEDGGCVVSR